MRVDERASQIQVLIDEPTGWMGGGNRVQSHRAGCSDQRLGTWKSDTTYLLTCILILSISRIFPVTFISRILASN